MAFENKHFQELQKSFSSEGEKGLADCLRRQAAMFDDREDAELAARSAKMLLLFAGRRYAELFHVLDEASEACPGLPQHLLVLGLYAASLSGATRELAWPLFRYAEAAAAKGQGALALEMTKRTYNLANFGRDSEFVYKPSTLLRVAALLERIAAPWLSRPPVQPELGEKKLRPRVAMLTVNMVDGGQAYAKTAVQFARYVDRSKYDCYEYFADECVARRQYAEAISKFDNQPSELLGPKALAEMRALGVETRIAPGSLDWLEASLWLADALERDRIDVAVFQGGLAQPMLWMAAKLARVPVKTSLCLGVNMYQKGLDATVYMSNSVNMEKERAFWRPEWGAQAFLHGGADLKEAAGAVPLKRADFQIPEDAVAFGILSNYVSTRVTDEYLSCVAKVLEASPKALFVCMGAGEAKAQKEFMAKAGLLERCRWLSWQHKSSFSSLKLLDFYFNEIPVGSAQAIIECLACGVPATAMLYGRDHHQSVGADIVGPEFAVMERNLDAYAARAIDWALNPESRASAAKKLFERVSSLYSAEGFVRQLCEMAEGLLKAKGRIS